jgi:hypothetical protein
MKGNGAHPGSNAGADVGRISAAPTWILCWSLAVIPWRHCLPDRSCFHPTSRSGSRCEASWSVLCFGRPWDWTSVRRSRTKASNPVGTPWARTWIRVGLRRRPSWRKKQQTCRQSESGSWSTSPRGPIGQRTPPVAGILRADAGSVTLAEMSVRPVTPAGK